MYRGHRHLFCLWWRGTWLSEAWQAPTGIHVWHLTLCKGCVKLSIKARHTFSGPYRNVCSDCPVLRDQLVLLLGCSGHDPMMDLDTKVSRGSNAAYMCLFMWRARWSLREKARSHRWHWKGRCPVCFLKWRVSSSDLANFQPQPSQLQWYGFSPEREDKRLRLDHMAWTEPNEIRTSKWH